LERFRVDYLEGAEYKVTVITISIYNHLDPSLPSALQSYIYSIGGSTHHGSTCPHENIEQNCNSGKFEV